MGSTSSLGILFEIAANTEQAEAAMGRFRDTVSSSFKDTAKAPKDLDDALLTNRESVRLLSEEAGLHLPRAVTSAVAEMLPSIGELGGALVGAFAVKEIVAFGEHLYKVGQELDGVKEAAAAMKEAVDENEKLMMNYAKAHEQWARQQVMMLAVMADAATANAQIIADSSNASTNEGMLLGQLWTSLAGKSKEQQEEEKKAIVFTREHNELLNILNEDAVEDRKEFAQASTEAAREAAEDERFIYQSLSKWAEDDDRKRREIARGTLEAQRLGWRVAREDLAEVNRENREAERSGKEAEKAMSRLIIDVGALGPALQKSLPAFHAANQVLVETKTVLQSVAGAFIEVAMGAAQSGENMARAVETYVVRELRAIAVEAAIRAIYNTGLGLYYLAIQDYTDAGWAFAAAAEFGAIGAATGAASAALSGGHGGGGGGRGSRGTSRFDSAWQTGGGQGVERGGSGGSNGGGRSSGGQTIVQIQGNLNSNGQQQLAAFVGMGAAIGLYKFTSSGTGGVPAPRY